MSSFLFGIESVLVFHNFSTDFCGVGFTARSVRGALCLFIIFFDTRALSASENLKYLKIQIEMPFPTSKLSHTFLKTLIMRSYSSSWKHFSLQTVIIRNLIKLSTLL